MKLKPKRQQRQQGGQQGQGRGRKRKRFFHLGIFMLGLILIDIGTNIRNSQELSKMMMSSSSSSSNTLFYHPTSPTTTTTTAKVGVEVSMGQEEEEKKEKEKEIIITTTPVPLPPHPFFDFSVTSYIQCRLQLETYLIEYQFPIWNESKLPLLMNTYYLPPSPPPSQDDDNKQQQSQEQQIIVDNNTPTTTTTTTNRRRLRQRRKWKRTSNNNNNNNNNMITTTTTTTTTTSTGGYYHLHFYYMNVPNRIYKNFWGGDQLPSTTTTTTTTKTKNNSTTSSSSTTPKWNCHYNLNDNHYNNYNDNNDDPVIIVKAKIIRLNRFTKCHGVQLMILCPSSPNNHHHHRGSGDSSSSSSSSNTSAPDLLRLSHVTVDAILPIMKEDTNNNNDSNTSSSMMIPPTRFTYNVQPMIRCDELARKEAPSLLSSSSLSTTTTTTTTSSSVSSSSLPTSSSSSFFIGACTEIRSDSYHFLPQWIEYHRLLGIQHFWIYINEEWNSTTSQLNQYFYNNDPTNDHHHHHHANTSTNPFPPYSNYVTFVPYNYYKNDTNFFYQQPQNNECLYIGRQYNVDWMFMGDVDEYIYINTRMDDKKEEDNEEKEVEEQIEEVEEQEEKDEDEHQHQQPPPPERQQPQQYDHQIPILQEYLQNISMVTPNVANIELNSIPYGRHRWLTRMGQSQLPSTRDEFHTKSTLVIDYIWRRFEEPKSRPVLRHKNILRPDKVGFLNVHYVGLIQNGYISISPSANNVRINHYKLPWERVFGVFGFNDYKDRTVLVSDPYLRDTFGTEIQKQVWNQWGKSITKNTNLM